MPSRDELIAERDRARDDVVCTAFEAMVVLDGTEGDERFLRLREAVSRYEVAARAVTDASPPRGSYRNARGIITPVVDELPEETISRMRDRGQP